MESDEFVDSEIGQFVSSSWLCLFGVPGRWIGLATQFKDQCCFVPNRAKPAPSRSRESFFQRFEMVGGLLLGHYSPLSLIGRFTSQGRLLLRVLCLL